MPVLCDRPDVIVLADEAHRSQYDTLALNMRAALPKALFLAFTGTPLIAGEERTKDVFGDYVSIYDFQQSVEDGATVPLFYENRTPELQLVNPDLNEDIYNLIEAAELDPEQEGKLERELSKQYHILNRDDRLETVAQDIVRHFLGRGFVGKAMVVSIDKATALKMHDKVRKHWASERQRVENEIAEMTRYPVAADVRRLKSSAPEKSEPPHVGCCDSDKMRELQQRLDVLITTDMAPIVSPGQNEIQQMQVHGLDIVPHRQRMNDSQPPLDEKFKDPDDALRIVFLCAMWLTGFDAPSCSTVYLDKPMRNRFKETQRKNTDLEILKAAIRAQLEKLIRLNKTRADFQEKFEQLIESYNAGSRNIEELFEELLKLSRNLSEEQQRHVRENMTEEELVIFDILTRPAPALSTAERAEVKKVTRELLARLKQLLVLNWRQKSSARSQLKLAIEDLLDTGLPRNHTADL